MKSDFVSCKPGRLVKLFREQGADDQKVGEDRTNRRGRWRIALAGDDYYAKVSRRVLSPGSHRHVCKSDTSPTI